MQKILLLMCGPSGAGKTYWVKQFTQNLGDKTVSVKHISRDEVRFSMVREDEEYFSHEDEVFAEWIKRIQEALDSPESGIVIADATHLSEKSRNKTLDHLTIPEGLRIIPVSINPGVEECLKRNKQRTGRAKVPRSVIRRMCFT